MGELVRHHFAILHRLRRVINRPEHYVAADSASQRIHRPRRLCRSRVRMHPDVAEVVPEARFEEGTSSRIKRLTG
jgi:hypothetical protein